MAKTRPDVFMPLYIGDYLSATARLTTVEHGAYLLLIMDHWMNGPLPNDDAVLASICRLPPDDWAKMKTKLSRFFVIDDESWHQTRVHKEWEIALEQKAEKVKRAKKAAQKRWENNPKKDDLDAPSNAPSIAPSIAPSSASRNATSNASRNACAMLEECPSPSPSPSPNNTYSFTKESSLVVSSTIGGAA